jgi:hypothetical protein
MARSLDALYERFGLDASAPLQGDPAALERLLAASLDGSLFRAELARLADEYAQLARAHGETVENARKFESESREWIAKLERDIAGLNADVQREVARNGARLARANAQLAIHKASRSTSCRIRPQSGYLKKVLDARSWTSASSPSGPNPRSSRQLLASLAEPARHADPSAALHPRTTAPSPRWAAPRGLVPAGAVRQLVDIRRSRRNVGYGRGTT